MKNNLDCLLVNPPYYYSHYPYLGLCRLAASLQQNNIKVSILDSAVEGFRIKDIIKYVVDKKPKIIGISIMSVTLHFCYCLIQELKDDYPEGVIVVGGAHINADPDILVPMGVKYGFRGECDVVFAEFCQQILAGKISYDLEGLIVNEDGNLIVNDPPIIEDLNTLPMPAYDLLPLDKYFSPNTNMQTISIITSSGCPYDCIYCSKLMKIRYRYLDTKVILDQLDILINTYGAGWIEFVDEIFSLRKNNIMELCEGIKQKGLKFSWGIQTRADRVDEELIRTMRAAGCEKIGFGVETGSERIRFLGHKNITNQQYKDAVKLCRKHEIKSMAHYIFGHYSETVAEMQETVSFAMELNTDIVHFNKMIPIPNSELFEKAKAEGTVKPDIWTSYMLGEIACPIYYPNGVTEKEVDKIYKLAWLKSHLSLKAITLNLWMLKKPRILYKSIKAFFTIIFGKRYERW